MPNEHLTSYAESVQSFDHRKIAELPQYRAASQALDALATAVEESGREMTLSEWLSVIRTMGVVLPFSDSCDEPTGHADEDDDRTAAPYAAEVNNGWLNGEYRCAAGHTWTCGYATSIADLNWG